MNTWNYPEYQNWKNIIQRPSIDQHAVWDSVQQIMTTVKERGDEAVREYALKWDAFVPDSFPATAAEIDEGAARCSESLQNAIQIAIAQIRAFHSNQCTSENPVESIAGVKCWRKSIAIQRVGLYIPGGTAPLFSTLLMLAIPAQIAGCNEISICTPPDEHGKLPAAICWICKQLQLTRLFKVGGAQAIAAMTFGTETIPAVDKIFGPGNQFVTAAKQQALQWGVAIDLPAGPSEVAVFADETGNPDFIAADMLSQAEHGVDSQVLLVTTCPKLIDQVQQSIRMQLQTLPRKSIAEKALAQSHLVLVHSEQEAFQLLNEYAPEHLILAANNAESLVSGVINAGSVFVGHFAPESAGDYASGTNHTLPTNGFARAFSGVSTSSFMKQISFQQLTATGLHQLAPAIVEMAREEGLEAHARAVLIRATQQSGIHPNYER